MMKTVLQALVLCLIVAGLGCSDDPRGPVQGKVTYKGKPLTTGMVIFSVNGRTCSGVIREDGTYQMPDAPLGEAQVAIQVLAASAPAGEDRSKGGEDRGGRAVVPVAIPPHYGDFNTSGLSATVAPGMTHDIPLS